jgi:hypothetical protein
MMRIHDHDGLRRLERELRDSVERARQVRDAHDRSDERDAATPPASVTVLPELVAEEPCATCDLEREQTPA